MMGSPNGDDALDSNIASLMKHEPELYLKNSKEHLEKNAKKTAEEWFSILMANAVNPN